MHVVDDAILGAWICFWAYWLVASFNVKATQTRSSGGIAFRVALVLVVLSLLRGRVIKGHAATVSDPVLQGIGLAVFFSGLALAVWARLYLGRNWGTPMSQKVDPELVTTGPYRFVRHPIYSGIILAMVGTTIAVSWYWLAGVIALGAYFTYSSIIEERNMSTLFPATYPAYERSTKKMIPFIF
jgi:protein-S-isoprenylcysteine O-methyltransferase Ste14